MEGTGLSFRPYISTTGFYLARGWVLWFVRHRKLRSLSFLLWGALFALMPVMSYQAGAAPAAPQSKASAHLTQVTNLTPPPAPASPAILAAQAAQQPAPAVQPFSYYRYNGYAYGNCTYYVANRRNIPRNWGNARSWFYSARVAGFATGSEPRAGAIAWTPMGYYGHVALVEEVSGSMVRISEMNFAGWNRISTRWVPASSFSYIY